MALVAILFFSPLSLMAQIPTPHAMPGRDKIQTALLAKLENDMQSTAAKAGSQDVSQYSVIVSLQRPQPLAVKATDYRSSAGLTQVQQDVEAIQNTVLQMTTPGSLTIMHRYQNLFGFSAMADREAIFSLVARDAVIHIEEMPVMYKMDAESAALTRVNKVHDLGYTGKGVTIAIIDDGIDAAHEAFGEDSRWPNQKIIGGYDFADDDDDPRLDCMEQSHGTAVAGVAVGNGGGIRGTAPDAKIVLLKLQHAVDCREGYLRGDLIAALDWVVTNRSTYGINIISMSLGGETISSACDQQQPLLYQAIHAAHQAGLIILRQRVMNIRQMPFPARLACPM
jgi:subtilisin family serine protease